MIICRKRNFVFLRVTKTASTSITHHLLDNIPREEIDHIARNDYIAELNRRHHTDSRVSGHATLGDAVRFNLITFNEALTLRVYAVIRNPIDRFLSAAHNHHVHLNRIPTLKSNLSNEEIVDQYLESKSLLDSGMGLPQYHWLEFNNKLISDIIVYPHFNKMFSQLGVTSNLEHKHRSEYRTNDLRINVSDYCKRKIIAKYERDWEIWRSIGE